MANNGHQIRFRDLRMGDNDTFNQYGVYPRHRLYPYNDDLFHVDPTKFSIDEKDSKVKEIDEELLNNFIDRVVLSAAMKEAGEKEYGLPKHDTLDSPSKRKNQYNGRNLKPRKTEKKNRKFKKEEKSKRDEETKPEEVPTHANCPFESTITLPVSEFRRMINAELESRAYYIHDFYQYQWDQTQDERMDAYRNVILWRDSAYKLETNFEKTEKELNKLQEDYEILKKELDNIKDAKRKRRNAAKSRRNNRDKNNNEDENKTQSL